MPTRPDRFFSLDALRGLAALTVVFWHWQHFFLLFPRAVPPPTVWLPFHRVFFLFYSVGWIAVDLFFSLSGFIFFWLYAEAISAGRISAWDFFVLRFSRLYPLHLVSLLAVAAGQLVFLRMTHGFFVYVWNDWYHFLLNLGFASGWGFEKGFSFNGPVWSVSVEVALYVMFFGLCRLMRARLVSLLAISAVGFVVVIPVSAYLGKGIGGFFLGGSVYIAYEWIFRKGFDRAFARTLPVVLAAAWVYVVVGPGAAVRHGGVARWRATHVEDYWPAVVLLFPLTILTLVVVERRRGTLGRRIASLGHISYSSYLLHFPLQLGVATTAVLAGTSRVLFLSPWFLLGFFSLLVGTSLASYHWLEVPAQQWIRGRLESATKKRGRFRDGRDE
jgi:peptidoglycan/LPS O-acetylase OafA/YrhL